MPEADRTGTGTFKKDWCDADGQPSHGTVQIGDSGHRTEPFAEKLYGAGMRGLRKEGLCVPQIKFGQYRRTKRQELVFGGIRLPFHAV